MMNEDVRLSDELLKEVPGGKDEDPGNVCKNICPCHSDGKHVFSILEPKFTLGVFYVKCECGAYFH